MQVDSQSVDPVQYVQQQSSHSMGEVKSFWEKLGKAYEKKLWHNITILLEDFSSKPSNAEFLIGLYDNFVHPIEDKLNPLKLVKFTTQVGRQYEDPSSILSFYQTVHSRLADPNPSTEPEASTGMPKPRPPPPAAEAYALSLSSIAYAQLLNHMLDESRRSLDQCEEILAGVDDVEPAVNAGLYGVSADYYKVKADYVAYYKASLLYLACINLEEQSKEDLVSRAHDLSIAALLGETIYNFGELLQHPLLNVLEDSPLKWIKDLLFVFNAGDIGQYEVLSQRLSEEPILDNDQDFLRQKICLMALIEAVFKRPRSQRNMSFQTIASETKLPMHEVEHLVMKALSLNLIKGSIDQVNSIADIHWVQPRVLDNAQTQALLDRLDQWAAHVGVVGNEVGSYKQPFAVSV
ncbi:26S proteasome regulatory subunit [Naganishia albida]|nr:26S proteasome regulatory subunit [Naganishia albida]